MNEIFFNEMQPCVIERLAEIYNCNGKYKQALKNETELFEQLKKNFSENQILMIKNYQTAIYSTFSICENIAYKQGMRDMAKILGIENKGN